MVVCVRLVRTMHRTVTVMGLCLLECGSGESSDVSTCTNCTALGMFVSGDGSDVHWRMQHSWCMVASAGRTWRRWCAVPCGAEIRIRVGSKCEACTHNASNCNGDGFAFVGVWEWRIE